MVSWAAGRFPIRSASTTFPAHAENAKSLSPPPHPNEHHEFHMSRIKDSTIANAQLLASSAELLPSTKPRRTAPVHPLWLRATHWLNALAVVLMATSGWRIYNASPLYETRFPGAMTLGGWLGGALQWHFAGMWLLAFNGLVYLTLNVSSGRLRSKFFPITVPVVWHDLRDALHGRLSHADPWHCNALPTLPPSSTWRCWCCPVWCYGSRCSSRCCAG